MNFLEEERRTLEQFLPTLDEKLRAIPFADLERPGNPGIGIYRELKGPSVLIPEALGGSGATPVDAVRIHRAIGSRSPSLAIAVAMHNFSVATLVEYSLYGDYTNDFMRSISADQLLVASGFAEGRTGTSILDPAMVARPAEGGYVVNGSKKPCSLTYSMHLLTASVAVPDPEAPGGHKRAVAIIPADAEGLDRRPFWANEILAGAESDELALTDVFVPDQLLFFPETQSDIDAVETGGFLWFELLISASYLGMASALAERVIERRRAGASELAALGTELEGAMSALEGVAQGLAGRERNDALLARCLFARFSVQQAIERASALGAELLGGMSFIGSKEASYLYAASRALAFHPPSRSAIAGSLAAYLGGDPFRML
ncbi:MAG TPA: acyl-CoA dehydrogenase family protein [Pyrinomonadaceae bacterium]|jgi:alkylation response protein AidB-like acyl-CoA dehydrogenase|nr:acyl-CoA dehydrogenase family protein [Pyrinomonadaceae bacterium]